MTIDGQSSYVVGLNQVGLRRAGFDAKAIVQLKDAYRVIYRSGLAWIEILAALKRNSSTARPPNSCRFSSSPSGESIPERRMPPGATLRIHAEDDEEAENRRAKAG